MNVTGQRAGKHTKLKVAIFEELVSTADVNGEGSVVFYSKDGHFYELTCRKLPKRDTNELPNEV